MAAAFLAFFLGVRHCAKTVENVTFNPELAPKSLPEDPLDKPPGVVGVDGFLILGREKGQWLEMKVASFWSHVE